MSAGYMRRCAGKKRFDTKEQALAARSALAGDNGLRKDQFHAYLCDQCLGYHVGGSRNVMISRRRSGKRPNKNRRGR